MLSQEEFQNIASLLAHVVRNWQNGKLTHLYEYCRQGKIQRGKYLQFQHHQSFHGIIFALPWP